jgi:hypothetical protein
MAAMERPRPTAVALALAALSASSRPLCGQDTFTLGFEGPASVTGSAGEKVVRTFYTTLTHSGPSPGAMAWSYGAIVEGAVMVDATLGGTPADKAFQGGYDATTVITPEINGGLSGMVSHVVLSFKKGTSLPANTTQRIARVEIEFTIPAGEAAPAALSYREGLVGDEGLVPVGVVHAGGSKVPVLTTREIVLGPAPRFRRGDVNRQPGINIADAISILQDLFEDGPEAPCRSAGDANDDGFYDLSDAVRLLDYLFSGSASPPAPFSGCGPDPTPDALPCETAC